MIQKQLMITSHNRPYGVSKVGTGKYHLLTHAQGLTALKLQGMWIITQPGLWCAWQKKGNLQSLQEALLPAAPHSLEKAFPKVKLGKGYHNGSQPAKGSSKGKPGKGFCGVKGALGDLTRDARCRARRDAAWIFVADQLKPGKLLMI